METATSTNTQTLHERCRRAVSHLFRGSCVRIKQQVVQLIGEKTLPIADIEVLESTEERTRLGLDFGTVQETLTLLWERTDRGIYKLMEVL